ncbi:Speckle-type POZ protein [Araneus ventricosus]|uniref:Speckle-type POZ protein n=1 Tax=Araneus ventricosus TaxID=182803 RepID=A0A4Y2S5S5_ARAVE|nr:Speckle-type POZ protein [Araneus ventricosus]
MNEFIFTWRIENISYSWHENLARINSPSFLADTLQNTVWTLRLNPRAKSPVTGIDSGECFSLYLIRSEDNGPRDFSFDYEYSLVSANNLTLKTLRPESFTAAPGRIAFFPTSLRQEVFVRKKVLYLQQDVLTLRCRMWKCEGDIDRFGQCFGRTHLEIERILSVADMNPKITRKKTILIHSEKRNTVLLSVNIFHEEGGLKIDIRRRDIMKIKVSTFKFSAVGRNRTPLSYCDSWLNMPDGVVQSMPFSDTESKASVTNKLKLTCEFIYSTGEETKSVEKVTPSSFKFPEFPSNCILSCVPSGKLADCPSICKDLWDLYSKQILCDVELKTQSTSFWVHKTVLCARSPVFLAMFTGEMKEKTSKCVEIEDLENDTLEKFLAFLYTDSFEESQLNAVVELYYAADKYQVERLKFFCRSFFANNINISNVCDLLMLADRHSDSRLKSRVEDYIVRHHKRIFRSSTWKEFSDKQPLMVAKTMLCKSEVEREKEKPAEEYKMSSYPNALDDFRSLYQSQTLSDIIIQTTSASFPAHKTILCAGSSRLRRVIARGKSTDSLKMEDLEDNTVSSLLLFLHTDSLGDIKWEDATKLYHAAIDYQIERLKIKCSCFFLENLKASNAADLLKLAHEHGDARLKSLVEDFISLHDEEMNLSEGWPETGQADPPQRMETRLSKRLRLENNKNNKIVKTGKLNH